MNRTVKTLSLAGLLALLALPAATQPTSPIALDGLSEQEAVRRVRAARPTQTFTLRGRTLTAAELQRDLARRAAAQRQQAQRALAAAVSAAPDPRQTLATANAQLEQERAARMEELRRLARRWRSCPSPLADGPELRRLAQEVESLLRSWERATPEQKVILSRRAQELARRLASLEAGGTPRP